MNTFVSQPYQLQESKKWIPHGTITEFISNSASAKISEVEMRDKEFDTQEEANKFFADYYTRRGFVENKKGN